MDGRAGGAAHSGSIIAGIGKNGARYLIRLKTKGRGRLRPQYVGHNNMVCLRDNGKTNGQHNNIVSSSGWWVVAYFVEIRRHAGHATLIIIFLRRRVCSRPTAIII